jgi:hypothetical protein
MPFLCGFRMGRMIGRVDSVGPRPDHAQKCLKVPVGTRDTKSLTSGRPMAWTRRGRPSRKALGSLLSRFDSSRSSRPASPHLASVAIRHDDLPVSEEASFLEHRAALDATLFAASGPTEFVFELEAGRLRRHP